MSAFVFILHETIMNVALPVRDLNITASAAQWLRSAFMLAMAVVIPMPLEPPASRGRTIFGLILSVFDWRWMFLLVLPIALTMLTIGAVWMLNVTEPRPTHFAMCSR